PLQVLSRKAREHQKRPGQPGRFFMGMPWARERAKVVGSWHEKTTGNKPMSEAPSRALPVQNAQIHPRGALDVLSRAEVARLRDASAGGMHDLLRRCALAVLTSGSASDDPRAARDLYPDFDIQVLQ